MILAIGLTMDLDPHNCKKKKKKIETAMWVISLLKFIGLYNL